MDRKTAMHIIPNVVNDMYKESESVGQLSDGEKVKLFIDTCRAGESIIETCEHITRIHMSDEDVYFGFGAFELFVAAEYSPARSRTLGDEFKRQVRHGIISKVVRKMLRL